MSSHEGALRQRKILELVAREGHVRVGDLSELFGVSAVTVRSDLDWLNEQELVKRTHGGAVLPTVLRFERSFEETSRERIEVKRQIGRTAARSVTDGETIILDVGSTTTELAKALSPKLQNVVVITNGLKIALLLERHAGITVVLTGGTLRDKQHSLINPFATVLLQELNVDRAFIGCNGVHPSRGITNANLQEAEVKRAMIASSHRAVVVADSTKVMNVSTAQVASIDRIDGLYTDIGADSVHIEQLRGAGLEITLCEEESTSDATT